LMDCGNGSLMRLQQRLDVADVDALLISHLHADHFADIYSLYYARRFHQDGERPLPVYAPAGAEGFISQLLPQPGFGAVCRFHDCCPGDVLQIGPMTVTLFAAAHPVETLAPRVEHDGMVVAYSADSGPSDQVVACARDADLLLCDSSWLERQRPLPPDLHMTGAEAGQTAARAGAEHLVITHVFPGNDPLNVAEEASSAFGGTVSIAADLEEYRL
jgi:ribonuclease BN (tRNA processing enzyme)